MVLNLRRRSSVKRGRYDEMPIDANARPLARLRAERPGAFGRAFREREDILARFGRRLMDAAP